MTDLEVGRKYRRDEMSPSDWDAYVADLRDGDHVEVWRRDLSGVRGRVAVLADGVVVRSAYDVTVARLVNSAGVLDALTEFTVLSLASREPSWAGARVVIDADGAVWVRNGDRYFQPGVSAFNRNAIALEAAYGPCRVLFV